MPTESELRSQGQQQQAGASSQQAGDLVVYAHYASQPSRAVLWALRLNQQPFKFVEIDSMKGDNYKPEFLKMNPSHTVPVIKDKNGCLFEAAAILAYLADEYNWDSKWYPKDNWTRAKINEYLAWHHNNTRQASLKLFRPILESAADPSCAVDFEKYKEYQLKFAKEVLGVMDKFLEWNDGYLATDHPTIADIFAYCELDQLHCMKLVEFSGYKRLGQWLENMKQLPGHDDVRRSLCSLKEKCQESTLFKKVQESCS